THLTYSVSQCDCYRVLPSFPTRRSSDLGWLKRRRAFAFSSLASEPARPREAVPCTTSNISVCTSPAGRPRSTSLPPTRGTCRAGDRKSTRLNSSHDQISYAVFCLKKKKN